MAPSESKGFRYVFLLQYSRSWSIVVLVPEMHFNTLNQDSLTVMLFADTENIDAPAPGDWTLVFHRNDQKTISGVTIGCWLARELEYSKQ